MDEDTRNDLIAAVWKALDQSGGDESDVQDQVDQAMQAWTPQDGDD